MAVRKRLGFLSASAPRQTVPARGSWLRGRRCAPTGQRFSAMGRVAELASRTPRAALKQLRRVSPRSALRAPTPGLRSSSLHKSPRAGTARRDGSSRALLSVHATAASAKACPGRPRRACGAPSSTGLAAARVSALRRLTRRHCLSAVSEANAASSATRPLGENRSAVGATRRPRKHQPPAGTAWGDATSTNSRHAVSTNQEQVPRITALQALRVTHRATDQ